jgi:hypothetical protein
METTVHYKQLICKATQVGMPSYWPSINRVNSGLTLERWGSEKRTV